MQNLIIILLACMLVSCAGSPDNLEGKRFDANSPYCRQMRRESVAVFSFNNDIAANQGRETNPKAFTHKPVSPIQLSNSKNAYERDCESQYAYRARNK